MTRRRFFNPFFLSSIMLSLVAAAPLAEASGKAKKKLRKLQAKKAAGQAKPGVPPPVSSGKRQASPGDPGPGPRPKPPGPAKRPAAQPAGAVETKAASGPGNPLAAAVAAGLKDLPPDVVRALLDAATPPVPSGQLPAKLGKALTARILLAPSPPDQAIAAAELGRRLQSGQVVKDFAGLDLRGSNLLLRGHDLIGANFYRAQLGSVDFGGEPVRDACFYRADIRGAKNLNLAGAQLHPFFQSNPGETVGTLRSVRLPGLVPGPPDHLDRILVTRERYLLWIREDGLGLRLLAPTGWSCDLTFSNGMRIQGLKEDPQGRLYLFSEPWVFLIPPGQLLQGADSLVLQGFPEPGLTGTPRGVAFTVTGTALFLQDRKIHMLNPRDMTHKTVPAALYGLTGDPLRLVAVRHPLLFLRDERPDWILVTDIQQETTYHVGLVGPVQDLAQGSGDTYLATLPADGLLAEFTFKKGEGEKKIETDGDSFPLEPRASGPRQPFCIAQGEDGHPWFTDPGARCIGRLEPDGTVTDFQLRPGDIPQRIFPSGDGRMLYTLKGQDRLGSIRVVAVPAAAPAPGAMPEEEEHADAAGETKASSFGTIQQEDFQETEAAEPAPSEAAPEGEDEPPAAVAEAVPEPIPEPSAAPEGKAEAPAGWTRPEPDPRLGTARRRLHLRGYDLDDDLAALILGKHKFKEDPAPGPAPAVPAPAGFRRFQGKSQFSSGVASVEDLAEFLAQGLAGEVTLEESDFPGREYWTFTLPGAGRVHAMDAAGVWRPSSKVLVITRQKPGPRNTSRRFIINAFPVPR